MNVPIWLGLEQVYQQFLLALVSLSSENNKRKNNLIFSFIAITQLFRLDKENVLDPLLRDDLARTGRPLGISFIVIGMLYLVSAFIRYFHSQVAMTKGYFPASRCIVIFTSTATLAALLAVFIVIVKNQ